MGNTNENPIALKLHRKRLRS